MKHILFGLTVLGSGVALLAQAPSEPKAFFNVAGAYAFLGDFDNTAGFTVNAGASLSGPHGAEVEVGYFNSGFFGDTVKFMPLTAGYRFTAKVDPKVNLFASALAGITWQKYQYRGVFGSGSSISDQAFTYGLKVGAQWFVAKNWSLDGSYTLLHLQKTDIGKGNISYVAATATYHF